MTVNKMIRKVGTVLTMREKRMKSITMVITIISITTEADLILRMKETTKKTAIEITNKTMTKADMAMMTR